MSAGADLVDLKRRMDGAINAFKSDIASLRTGRASANILDPVTVDAYGSRMLLSFTYSFDPLPRKVLGELPEGERP